MPQSILSPFVAGFVAGVVVSLLVALGARLVRSRGGPFSGVWEQQVADSRGGQRAKDRVECHQRGTRVEGRIRRQEPTVEAYKEWRFTGHVEGALLSGVMWSADTHRTPATFSALQLAAVDPTRVEGFVANRQLSQNGGRFIETALQSPLVWTRPSAASESPAQPVPAS